MKEEATGVSQNATQTETEIVRETTKVEFLSTTPKTFKPGMAFTGQVKICINLTVDQCQTTQHCGTAG